MASLIFASNTQAVFHGGDLLPDRHDQLLERELAGMEHGARGHRELLHAVLV